LIEARFDFLSRAFLVCRIALFNCLTASPDLDETFMAMREAANQMFIRDTSPPILSLADINRHLPGNPREVQEQVKAAVLKAASSYLRKNELDGGSLVGRISLLDISALTTFYFLRKPIDETYLWERKERIRKGMDIRHSRGTCADKAETSPGVTKRMDFPLLPADLAALAAQIAEDRGMNEPRWLYPCLYVVNKAWNLFIKGKISIKEACWEAGQDRLLRKKCIDVCNDHGGGRREAGSALLSKLIGIANDVIDEYSLRFRRRKLAAFQEIGSKEAGQRTISLDSRGKVPAGVRAEEKRFNGSRDKGDTPSDVPADKSIEETVFQETVVDLADIKRGHLKIVNYPG
jgi:hypothetical protein